ncbi:hypothetical protein EJ02DRAFT_41887 [Clathrospora elynae]|uniref:Uncharacterized protein n=1 Tax=Clathrospora elynae TaxID=706981 RepID=A0A6A5SE54_9PLEO|nr:hypothetical protein EJ02DRAFT_41887 [Clathrospora elynae]
MYGTHGSIACPDESLLCSWTQDALALHGFANVQLFLVVSASTSAIIGSSPTSQRACPLTQLNARPPSWHVTVALKNEFSFCENKSRSFFCLSTLAKYTFSTSLLYPGPHGDAPRAHVADNGAMVVLHASWPLPYLAIKPVQAVLVWNFLLSHTTEDARGLRKRETKGTARTSRQIGRLDPPQPTSATELAASLRTEQALESGPDYLSAAIFGCAHS